MPLCSGYREVVLHALRVQRGVGPLPTLNVLRQKAPSYIGKVDDFANYQQGVSQLLYSSPYNAPIMTSTASSSTTLHNQQEVLDRSSLPLTGGAVPDVSNDIEASASADAAVQSKQEHVADIEHEYGES